MSNAGVTAPRGASLCVRVEPGGQSFAVEPGQTLLLAALAAGFDWPYECASGSCGTCRAQWVQGEVEPVWASAPGLSARDRQRGDRILACQSRVRTNGVVRARLGNAAPPLCPRRWQAVVSAVRPLNRDVILVRLDAGEAAHFLPGQFMVFELPGGTGRRAYSMSNLPAAHGLLEFMVKRKPGGAGSAHLFGKLAAGDRIGVEGPYGHAWLRADGSPGTVLLAGGSGLGPIWSIAQAALQRASGGAVHLYFGANTASDLFWLDELEDACRSHPRLNVNLVLREPSASDPAQCRYGLVGDVMAADVGAVLADDLYVAGPPGLVDSVLRGFVATGRARADRVFFDRFA